MFVSMRLETFAGDSGINTGAASPPVWKDWLITQL